MAEVTTRCARLGEAGTSSGDDAAALLGAAVRADAWEQLTLVCTTAFRCCLSLSVPVPFTGEVCASAEGMLALAGVLRP